jgi:formyltetrahydrofolate synthetase
MLTLCDAVNWAEGGQGGIDLVETIRIRFLETRQLKECYDAKIRISLSTKN